MGARSIRWILGLSVLGAACVPDGTFMPTGALDASAPPPPALDSSSPPPVDAGVLVPDAGFEADAGWAPAPDASPPDTGPEPTGIPILGGGRHTIDAVTVTPVVPASIGYRQPTDLAFNPQRPGELWVMNQEDNSVWIIQDPGDPGQSAEWRFNRSTGPHFLPRPSALAFGQPGTFATIHEEDRLTQGNSTPADFMGPSLWTSNLAIFDAGHEGHIDMLHNTPNGMGIAWERDNLYWVFDGAHSSITRYDFNRDHGPGGSDHSDGVIARFAEGQVRRVAGVPSHLVFDHAADRLLVADTGNGRVAAFDPRSGTRGAALRPNYDGITQYMMNGAQLDTLIDGLGQPSGIEIEDGMVFVTDNQRSTISAYTMAGELVDYLETGLPTGALMGITFDARGRMYVIDHVGEQVLRIEAR